MLLLYLGKQYIASSAPSCLFSAFLPSWQHSQSSEQRARRNPRWISGYGSTKRLQNPFYGQRMSTATILQFLLFRNKTGLVICDHHSTVRSHATHFVCSCENEFPVHRQELSVQNEIWQRKPASPSVWQCCQKLQLGIAITHPFGHERDNKRGQNRSFFLKQLPRVPGQVGKLLFTHL